MNDEPTEIISNLEFEWQNSSYYCHNLPSLPQPDLGKILITGASGYIGGRLLPELVARGYSIRVMVRAESLEIKKRWPQVEVVVADAVDEASLNRAMEGISVAYYLIHSLLTGRKEFEDIETQSAINFRNAAEKQNVKRIIYLGGLGNTQAKLSPHLKSRFRVAQELGNGMVPVTILRAAVIIGSGSASYEIIKDLVKKLPVFPIPKWANNKCQPISIRDVTKYLVGCLETPATEDETFDIGGPDILTYKGMLAELAHVLDKKRFFIPFNLFNIRFYAYVASMLTPVPAPITQALMEGLKNEVCCKQDDIHEYIPIALLTYKQAVLRAMTREEQDRIYTRWSDAYPPAHELALKLHELEVAPQYTTSYSLMTEKSAESLFQSFCKVGGKEGWFANNWMWRLRGWLDRLLLGVGTSRGRRSYSTLSTHDVIDFWRIEEILPNQRLLLRAEMKLPGKAWLEFKIDELDQKRKLTVTPYYQTFTLFGKFYWYIFLPFHEIIFNDLIKQIEKRS